MSSETLMSDEAIALGASTSYNAPVPQEYELYF